MSLPPLRQSTVTMQPEAMIDFDFDILPERDPFMEVNRDPFRDVNMKPRNYEQFKPKHIMPEVQRNDMIDELLADLEEDLKF